jgi:hypothetical protein
MVLVVVRNWFDGPRIGRIWICENPSNPLNPWSIHLATQIQDTTNSWRPHSADGHERLKAIN